MTVDVTKLQFYSGHPIDKIVSTGTVSYTNNGDTTATGTGDGDQLAKVQADTIANPYGKIAFCRYVWSIDGVNYNSAEAHLVYSYTTTFTNIPVTSSPAIALKAAVSVGVSASLISFYTGNGLHGNVSRLSSSPSTAGYTPTSQAFTIKYALFEVS